MTLQKITKHIYLYDFYLVICLEVVNWYHPEMVLLQLFYNKTLYNNCMQNKYLDFTFVVLLPLASKAPSNQILLKRPKYAQMNKQLQINLAVFSFYLFVPCPVFIEHFL